jgi:hypothetical protein
MLSTGPETASQSLPHAEAGGEPVVLVPAPHEYPQRDRASWLLVLDWLGLPILMLAVAATIYPQSAWSPFYPAVIAAALTLVFLSMSMVYRVTTRRARHRAAALGPPKTIDPYVARLVCFGEATELHAIAQQPPWEFEPVIVKGHRTGYRQDEPRRRVSAWAATVRVLIFAGPLVFVILFPGAWRAKMVCFTALYVTVAVCMARLNSVYYRIGPQRLEVLACAFPRFNLRILDALDLSRSRIVCWYPNQVVSITPWESAGQPDCRISLQAVHEPHRLVEGLFRAARSTRGPIPLPANELLG